MISERTAWQPRYIAPDVKNKIATIVDNRPDDSLRASAPVAKRLLEELLMLSTMIIIQNITKVD